MTGRDHSRAGDRRPMAPGTTTAVMAPAERALDCTAVPAAGAALEARVFTGPDLGSALANAWDDLFSRVPGASYCLSRAWQGCFVTAGRCGDGPVAVTVWHGPRLVALFVLALRRRAGLRFADPVGTGYPGYLGVLAEPACEAAADMVAATCVQERIFDVLCLHDVASDDVATQRLVAGFSRRGLSVRRVDRTVCWRARLGCTFEQFLTTNKSAKSRKKLRWKERQVQRAGRVTIERMRGAEVTPAVVARIARLRSSSWMKRRGALLLNEPFERTWLQRLADTDMLRVWVLSIDGEDAACIVAIVANGQLHYRYPAFKLSYEHLSVGQVLLQYSIADACAEDLQMYDLGHGDADYKRFWANDSHYVQRVFVGRGLIGAGISRSVALAWQTSRSPYIGQVAHRLRAACRGTPRES